MLLASGGCGGDIRLWTLAQGSCRHAPEWSCSAATPLAQPLRSLQPAGLGGGSPQPALQQGEEEESGAGAGDREAAEAQRLHLDVSADEVWDRVLPVEHAVWHFVLSSSEGAEKAKEKEQEA